MEDEARKASRCRPQVRERIAEARAANGEGARLAFAAALRRQKTEGEITRGCCLHRGLDEHQVKKRSFAFSLAYIKCFRTYSVYLSLRLPAQILYAGIHLPPQREARALPRQRKDSPHSIRFYRKMRSAALFRSVFGRSSPIFFSKFVKK